MCLLNPENKLNANNLKGAIKMTTAKLEILFIDAPRSGVSPKTQKPWTMQTCQCVIHDEDGTKSVGEMVLPKDIPIPAVGFYDALFKIGVDFNKKVTGYLVGLTPCASARPAAARPA